MNDSCKKEKRNSEAARSAVRMPDAYQRRRRLLFLKLESSSCQQENNSREGGMVWEIVWDLGQMSTGEQKMCTKGRTEVYFCIWKWALQEKKEKSQK